ncbi:MAG: SsrA-binding protein SmpB [Minisyncoccia bacterium]
MSILENKKARLNYTFLDTFEAGIELHGHEVKSLRDGKGKLDGARVVVRGGEAYVVGMSISPWQVANTPKDYEPERTRRLLLHTKEILAIQRAEQEQGLTAIPISLYNKKRFLKLSVVIAKGKKKHDKRASIREREVARDINRSLKS